MVEQCPAGYGIGGADMCTSEGLFLCLRASHWQWHGMLNIPLNCLNICHCDWLNKEAYWSITGQVEIRWESQTENSGKKKSEVWES